MAPGTPVLVQPALPAVAAGHFGRKTDCDLLCVRHEGIWACVDARLPPRLFAAALTRGALPGFTGYRVLRAEPRFGRSRFDLLLEPAGPETDPDSCRPCLVETKSVTLVQQGRALFPDAPTARGARHMEELAAAVQSGHRAAAVFVVQRQDACSFAPHDPIDPDFGRALRRSAAAGVEVLAYRCRVSEAGISLAEPLPVNL